MQTTVDLQITRHQTYRFPFRLTTAHPDALTQRSPVLLSTDTFELYAQDIKKQRIATFDNTYFTITDGFDGRVELALTSNVTATIRAASGSYDLFWTNPAGERIVLLRGNFTVLATAQDAT